MNLDIEVYELYGKMGLLFQPNKMGPCKFYFLETPVLRAKAKVQIASKTFEFDLAIENVFLFMVYKILFEGAVWPEFITIDLPLTDDESRKQIPLR